MRRGLSSYVAALMTEPEASDVAWLASAASLGDADRARWELRYARRALGLLVAQRDALDDRTASLVARELANALQSDRNIAASMVKLAERQFNDRLSSYRDVVMSRASADPMSVRLGRTLLQLAGAPRAPDDVVARAGDALAGYLTEANDALRKAFGTASLPDDLPPSALAR
jgi:hypothetical protein